MEGSQAGQVKSSLEASLGDYFGIFRRENQGMKRSCTGGSQEFPQQDRTSACFAGETTVGRSAALPWGCTGYSKILIWNNSAYSFGNKRGQSCS